MTTSYSTLCLPDCALQRDGVTPGDGFVDLDAQTGALAQALAGDLALLYEVCAAQQVVFPVRPLGWRLQDQEVRQAGRQVGAGGRRHRARVVVGRDGELIRLGPGGDLLRFEDAPGPLDVRLQHVHRLLLDHRPEGAPAVQRLAGGDALPGD